MRPCFTKKIKKKGTPVSGRTLDLNYSVWRLAASVRIQFLFFSWLIDCFFGMAYNNDFKCSVSK